MSLLKSDDFIADVERQFEWYAVNAGWEVADRYLLGIETTARLLEQHPQLGPRVGFAHLRLREWRFFVVFRPFQKHVLFYEVDGDDLILRRPCTVSATCQSDCLSHPPTKISPRPVPVQRPAGHEPPAAFLSRPRRLASRF